MIIIPLVITAVLYITGGLEHHRCFELAGRVYCDLEITFKMELPNKLYNSTIKDMCRIAKNEIRAEKRITSMSMILVQKQP